MITRKPARLLPIEFVLPLFFLVTVPLLWRRTATLNALNASAIGLLVNLVLTGTDVLRCGVVFPVVALFVFTAASQLAARDARKALAIGLGMIVIDFGTELGAGTTVVFVIATLATFAIALLIRSRRRLAGELEARTAELREARDERARFDVAGDRTRISRELDAQLHDRLGHLATLAESGSASTLAEIEHESRRTLEQMREVVGVLRYDSADALTAPQPAITQLTALLERARERGADVAIDGNPRALPAGVELSAYRIVEHLLAALEEAPGVAVRVHFGDDALGLEVSGPARRRAKPAIELARQRVQLHRGTLDASTRGGRTEAVASLPVIA